MVNLALTTVCAAVDSAADKLQNQDLRAQVDNTLPLATRAAWAELRDFASRRPDVQLPNLADSLTELQANENNLSLYDRETFMLARDALGIIKAHAPDLPEVAGVVSKMLDRAPSAPMPPGEVAPSQDYIRKVNGQYVAVLANDFLVENRTVAEVAPLLDPLNWPDAAGSTRFFRTMTAQNPPVNNEGWSRVLENVGSADFNISTALKYWKGEAGGSAFLNYDLDDVRTGDEGWAVIDNGFLIATQEGPHVRIRVSKELLVKGLSPTATAVLAYSVGWPRVAIDVANGADGRGGLPADAAAWAPSAPLPENQRVVIVPAPLPEPDLLPPRARSAVIRETSGLLNTFVDRTSKLADEFAGSWQNGLTVADVRTLSGHFSDFVGTYSESLLEVPRRLFLGDAKAARQ